MTKAKQTARIYKFQTHPMMQSKAVPAQAQLVYVDFLTKRIKSKETIKSKPLKKVFI